MSWRLNLLLGLVGLVTAGAARGESGAAPCATCPALPCGYVRAQDQVWLVSTRCLGCPNGTAPALQVWKNDGQGNWVPSTLDAFLATDNPAMPTDVYVHGNDTDAATAASDGMRVYQHIVQCAPAERGVRFVLWSWPTEQYGHPIRSTREHARRADVDGYYLGWFLSRIDRRVPIGLVGYSFGARVVTGGMHVLGGGMLCGQSLGAQPAGDKPQVRAVLVAAAENCDWISPGRPNEMAVPISEEMLLMNNYCDRALRFYPHIDRCTRPEALGYVGVGPVSEPQKIRQINECCAVGSEHNWRNYFYNQSVVAQLRPYIYLN